MLGFATAVRGGLISRKSIASEVRMFCDPDKFGRPEFWAYYADYDWVVLCQLFGTMMDLPAHWPMFCMDIKQLWRLSRRSEVTRAR